LLNDWSNTTNTCPWCYNALQVNTDKSDIAVYITDCKENKKAEV